jgi:hypothetical protein
MCSSGSDFLTNYGSGSTSQKVTVSTVPVPQHCLVEGGEGRGLKERVCDRGVGVHRGR